TISVSSLAKRPRSGLGLTPLEPIMTPWTANGLLSVVSSMISSCQKNREVDRIAVHLPIGSSHYRENPFLDTLYFVTFEKTCFKIFSAFSTEVILGQFRLTGFLSCLCCGFLSLGTFQFVLDCLK